MKVVLLLVCLGYSLASPVKEASKDQIASCSATLKGAGASSNFGGNVAHALHSVTVNALKQFEASVTAENSIPTINMDLTSNVPILPNAPDRKAPDAGMFETDAMRTLDIVMSHADDAKWGLKNYSPLERVVHAFHMKEIWARTLSEYMKLKANPPSAEVCKCAVDEDHNGIMSKLRYVALAIREPELIYDNKKNKDIAPQYTLHVEFYTWDKFGPALFNDAKEKMTELTGAVSWKEWKEGMKKGEATGHAHDTALYLFCKLNKA